MMAKEIQKPPYDESAVAPKVLPTAISLSQTVCHSILVLAEYSLQH